MDKQLGFTSVLEEHEHCNRCGRRLKNIEARQIGYGKTCYKKMMAAAVMVEQMRGDQNESQSND